MADDSRWLYDPAAIRAIAHPLRARILDEMHAVGPTRAADLAGILGVPANKVSFHLRQLARYGLIEEAPEEARDRRDRVWRVASEEGLGIRLNEVEEQPGGRSAVRVWRRTSTAWAHHAVEAAYGEREHDPDTFTAIANHTIRLTKAEAEELADELDELLNAWTDRVRARPDDARSTYLFHSMLQPYPEVPEAPEGR